MHMIYLTLFIVFKTSLVNVDQTFMICGVCRMLYNFLFRIYEF
jgi:hypothetical protein